MTLKILVTGGTGFVGKHLIRLLAEHDVELHLVVRENHENDDGPLPSVVRVVRTPDLFSESPSWWEDVCHGLDVVIHLAWYVEPGKYLESPLNLDCLIGSLNLAKGAASAGVRRFIGIGTCFEYDLSSGYVSVETPLKPETPYAASKAALFLALSQWLPLESVSFAWCRVFYLYGEGEDKRRLVPYIRSQLEAGKVADLSSGNQIRDFMDVVDAARAIVHIAVGDQDGPFDICTGIPTTVRELATNVAKASGRVELLNFGGRADSPLDPTCVVGVPPALKS